MIYRFNSLERWHNPWRRYFTFSASMIAVNKIPSRTICESAVEPGVVARVQKWRKLPRTEYLWTVFIAGGQREQFPKLRDALDHAQVLFVKQRILKSANHGK
jgi:hypothetical protein